MKFQNDKIFEFEPPAIKKLNGQITLRLDDKLHTKIKLKAISEGRSKANLIRHILEQHLN